MDNKPTKSDSETHLDDLLIIELDERLEFSAGVIDSDLDVDSNGAACNNSAPCTAQNLGFCTNQSSCC